jgi:hypothetical protein
VWQLRRLIDAFDKNGDGVVSMQVRSTPLKPFSLSVENDSIFNEKGLQIYIHVTHVQESIMPSPPLLLCGV